MANRLRRPDQPPQTQLRVGPQHDRQHRRRPDLDRTRSPSPQPGQDRRPDHLNRPPAANHGGRTPTSDPPTSSQPTSSGPSSYALTLSRPSDRPSTGSQPNHLSSRLATRNQTRRGAAVSKDTITFRVVQAIVLAGLSL